MTGRPRVPHDSFPDGCWGGSARHNGFCYKRPRPEMLTCWWHRFQEQTAKRLKAKEQQRITTMTKDKIDCVGEDCANCGKRKSCLRVALLTKDGEYAAYTDVCYRCAFSTAVTIGMDGIEVANDLAVYHERAYGNPPDND